MLSPATTEQTTVPLCVDLDGTLMKSDLVWESLVRLLRKQPLYILLVPFWLWQGRARLKDRIAERVEVDVTSLPYYEEVVRYVRSEHESGRVTILATASDRKLAERVAEHFGFFSEVLASDGKTNLRGQAKGAKLAERFGERGFDYAGNSSVDLPVWERARHAIVVTRSGKLEAAARHRTIVSRIFEGGHAGWRAVLQALRPHQWLKNLLVFIPLLTLHSIDDLVLVWKGFAAFAAFSLCASGVYLLDALFHLDADRQHPSKRFRLFAGGELPLALGLILGPFLIGLSAVLAANLSWSFGAVLGIFVLLSMGCSWLSKPASLNVFFAAGLYAVRLLGGHEATGLGYSFWLLVFWMCILVSLSFVKRFSEFNPACRESRADANGRSGGPCKKDGLGC
jgi:phosphoserine phosphatase